MPSFDIVSEFDKHEGANAVDQANREVQSRFDFKGVDASFTLEGDKVQLEADVDFQLKQMLDVLRARLIARGIDARCMDVQDPVLSGVKARQEVAHFFEHRAVVDHDPFRVVVREVPNHAKRQ